MERQGLEDEMNNLSKTISVHAMTEMLSYAIWGAAATTTRAFGKVTLKISPETNRIFVAIQLRWWAKFKKFEPFRKFWLKKAEKRCQEQTPEGWRLLVYYDKGGNDGRQEA